ncbi:hypothetical protein F441_03280 [Phytophthora nicotianae CJ01A1]|uniref:Uncharacterized protein n=1 Tax=Phytophthora nicotianae CJ01A1 TaxID=1317063 RepID=W2XNW4_PHYNI|nr:hypothetical protein F441_03280 [Phytophthora nicotianae CJ01A1]
MVTNAGCSRPNQISTDETLLARAVVKMSKHKLRVLIRDLLQTGTSTSYQLDIAKWVKVMRFKL